MQPKEIQEEEENLIKQIKNLQQEYDNNRKEKEQIKSQIPSFMKENIDDDNLIYQIFAYLNEINSKKPFV